MNRIFSFLKEENSLSIKYNNYKVDNDLHSIKKIYDPNWENTGKNIPYEALTQLIDSYTYLIGRPDLAFLFCWEAINNSYNELILKDTILNCLTDTKGIKLLTEAIYSNYTYYSPMISTYISKIPLKLCRYVSSYILKGFIFEKKNFSSKYINPSYNTLKKTFPKFHDIITKTYGEKLLNNSSPKIINNHIELCVNRQLNRKITYSLGLKIKELILSRPTTIKTSDKRTTYTITFTQKEILDFLFLQILYASRCNNFHGNVASRLNSNYVNQESYDAYKYIYLLAHVFLSIAFHINGYIDNNILNSLKGNENLL